MKLFLTCTKRFGISFVFPHLSIYWVFVMQVRSLVRMIESWFTVIDNRKVIPPQLMVQSALSFRPVKAESVFPSAGVWPLPTQLLLEQFLNWGSVGVLVYFWSGTRFERFPGFWTMCWVLIWKNENRGAFLQNRVIRACPPTPLRTWTKCRCCVWRSQDGRAFRLNGWSFLLDFKEILTGVWNVHWVLTRTLSNIVFVCFKRNIKILDS